MSFQFTVSPDFPPTRLPSWYLFNTWLQKSTGLPIHLEMFTDFESQREAIANDKIDLIYANPYDAAMLVREKGFTPLVRPKDSMDEAVILAPADSPYGEVEDLKSGIRVAVTNDPAVNLLGMMMLEPAELHSGNIEIIKVDSYQAAIRKVLQGEAEIAFLLKNSMIRLSKLVQNQLKIIVESQIGDLYHTFLASTTLGEHADTIKKALLDMHNSPKGREVLEGLEIPAWEEITPEETDFMINLIEALK